MYILLACFDKEDGRDNDEDELLEFAEPLCWEYGPAEKAEPELLPEFFDFSSFLLLLLVHLSPFMLL